jgi:hypothetical protein
VSPFLRILQPQLADGVQRLHVDGRWSRTVTAAGTEHIGSSAFELRFPRCDLIGMDVELLRQLGQCSIWRQEPPWP